MAPFWDKIRAVKPWLQPAGPPPEREYLVPNEAMNSLNEVESRLIASERWIDIPLKKQDYSHLNLDATSEGEPAEYYRNMFDLIALAFDADITPLLSGPSRATRRGWSLVSYCRARRESPTSLPWCAA